MTSKQLIEYDRKLKAKGYKYLGFENDWGGLCNAAPVLYLECKRLGHKTETQSTDFGDHTTSCDACRIYFKMDSGD